MSVWDDSWGYLSAPSRGVVRGDRMAESGTARCVNTEPLLTTVTRAIEEVAGMTPAYLGTICQQVDHSVIPPGGAT